MASAAAAAAAVPPTQTPPSNAKLFGCAGAFIAVIITVPTLYFTKVFAMLGHAFAHTKACAWLNSDIPFIPHKLRTTWGGGLGATVAVVSWISLISFCGVEITKSGKKSTF